MKRGPGTRDQGPASNAAVIVSKVPDGSCNTRSGLGEAASVRGACPVPGPRSPVPEICP
jgi:hypothetical protein